MGLAPPEIVVSGPRVVRLSHAQWENTVRDLLALDAAPGLSPRFAPDARAGSAFDTAVDGLLVTPDHFADYQSAAETLAAMVARSASARARITPPGLPPSGEERTRAWMTFLARRAYRRPPLPKEVDALVALYGRGATVMGGDTTAAGIELVLRALLQSPAFLYRIERSDAVSSGEVRLDGFERASRLSYTLWNTMPDEALFEDAASGALDDEAGLAKAAERMVADPRAEAGIISFHRQLFKVDAYANISKNTKAFPTFTPNLNAVLAAEHESFIRDAVLTEDGGIESLLTASYTYANEDTAPLYGLTGTFGRALTRVQLDRSQRAGILTQLGFLAYNATAAASDPIHRGVFISLHILCTELPPPPANVPPLPADDGTLTTRQQVERYTGVGTCGAGCHGQLINPIGFAFEHYDALGAWRETDRGQPIDASARYEFQEGIVSYDGAPSLMEVLVSGQEIHSCYARNLATFALGREMTPEDEGLVARLAARSSGDGSMRQMLLALTAARSFRNRAPEEVTK